MSQTTDQDTAEAIARARLISAALPYMLAYDGKVVVVKYGGHAMGDPDLSKAFARDITLLETSGAKPVVVHGGGPQIGDMLKRLDIQSEFRSGLRVTDKKTVEVVEMVLAGSINKEIVMAINAEGGKAVGLSGKDGNMVFAEKVTRKEVDPDSNIEKVIDLGFVGEPKTVNRAVIDMVLSAELIPVIAPVAPGSDGNTYNVNADTFAGAVAGALNAITPALPHRRARRARSRRQAAQAAHRGAGEGADRRRHHLRRHDPQGRDLHRGAGEGRRGRRHPQRQDAACGAPRALYRPRRRHADPAMSTAPDLGRFATVDNWVFDLDNTLYPRATNLFMQVDQRIRAYVGRLLDIGPDEAHRVQKDYYRRYGTTLRGLMEEHGIKPDDFLEYVHDIDHSVVMPDPRLARAIERLPGRKFILTNGSRAHAEKVAARLGIPDHFEEIFDIVSSELLPKPNRETYDRFLEVTGVDPRRAAMFEDLARNLEVPERARHGDRAGGAARHPRSADRGLGDGGPRRAACRVRQRRPRRLPRGGAQGAPERPELRPADSRGRCCKLP